MLQRPTPVLALAATDDVHCLRQTRVAGRVDRLKVIECAEDVVVPSRRKSEASEYRLDDFARTLGAKEAVCQEELPAAALRDPRFPDRVSAAQFVEPQALEHAYGRVDGSVRCTVRAPTIPPTIGHLLFQQVAGDRVEQEVHAHERERIEQPLEEAPRPTAVSNTG